jgi:uncharacterized protein YcfJ
MKIRAVGVCVVAGLITTACVTVPTGPSVMVLPGSGKTFDQFQFDEASCRQWASQQAGTTTAEASTNTTVAGAAIGTVLGAAAGAAIGAAAGSPATGAAVGAGVGLLGGTSVGASNASASYRIVQRRYDDAYTQCMYAKGHQIPVARGSQPAYSAPTYAPAASSPPPPPPPPATTTLPPPPAGPPPPPPPGPSR